MSWLVRCLRLLQGHRGPLLDLDFSPSGSSILTASEEPRGMVELQTSRTALLACGRWREASAQHSSSGTVRQ